MANTFLKANGVCVGKSLFEEDKLDVALELQENARKKNVKIYLPVDFICAKSIDDNKTEIFDFKNIPSNYSCYDIGNKSIILFKKIILKSKKIIWNGPMESLKLISSLMEHLISVIWLPHPHIYGGLIEAVASVKINNKEKILFISTGGGALAKYCYGSCPPSN